MITNNKKGNVYKKTIYRRDYLYLISFLKKQRENKNISQTELGSALGQDQSFVSKYENGVRRLDITETLDICEVLSIPFEALIIELRNNK